MLYLHEVIDIVGTGQEAYMASVAERADRSKGLGIARLFGCWKVIGSTSRWPAVVNLWEMDDWAAWARALERQFVPEHRDPSLAPWWARATAWRSGGFDRILDPTPYSPSLRDLERRGLRAWVCIQTVARMRPGVREAYLDAVGDELRPALEGAGLTLMGAYRVPMRNEEALLLWAAPDFRTATALWADRRRHRALRRWTRRQARWEVRLEMSWLVPGEFCFFHPRARKSSPEGS